MGTMSCVASSKGGINLAEIKNKGLTDGEAYVNTVFRAQEKSEKAFLKIPLQENKELNE